MQELMRDASNPGGIPVNWTGAVAGYIGGDTPHVWTNAEWQKFRGQRKLPIFVRSDPGLADPEADAFDALRRLYQLGVPLGSRTALDLEMAQNPSYVNRYAAVMHFYQFHVWPYGSAGFVFANPPADGYWVADYTGSGPFMYPHPDVRATQYANGQNFDSSTVKDWVYADLTHWWV